ncbi:MAG: hypothetical protein NTV30_04710, partial [Chloroflexi bacterium]|nr:hypothetical protein [Chloroflexota bacterium]
TCFRIDGLTGLLTKEAKLTVKYTSYDLEQAGGNLSKLRLARWDEIANKWTVIDTIINEQSMTLTVQTNHFSLWSVMIDESAIDNGLIFSIVVCVSIFISIPAIILLVRKLRH